MRILDRYLLKSFFTFLIMGLGTIAAIFMVVSVLDTLSYYFVSREAKVSQMVLLYLYEEPGILYMSMPLAVLLSFCITLGLLEQRRETVAIKASGISLFRLSLPLLFASAAVTLVMLYIGNNLVPIANRKSTEMKYIMKNRDPQDALKGEFVWYVEEDPDGGLNVFQIDSIDKKEREARGFRMYKFDRDLRLEREMYSTKGKYMDGEWHFRSAHLWDYHNDKELDYGHFKRLKLDLEKPGKILVARRDSAEMTSAQLRRLLGRLGRYGFDEREYWTELRMRQALPFAAIIMALLAVPFGFRPSRSSTLARNLLFAVIVGFAYFAVMGESISLAKNGTLPPAFGAWIANIIFGAVGILFFSGTRQ